MQIQSRGFSTVSKYTTDLLLVVMYPGHLEDWYTGLGTQTLVPKKVFLTFYLKIFFKASTEKSVSLFNLCNLENVLQRNLRTGMARECIFRASGGTRFKNFNQPWWQKGGRGSPRCNRSTQKNSGYITDLFQQKKLYASVCISRNLAPKLVLQEQNCGFQL